jgi:hypothetical protein
MESLSFPATKKSFFDDDDVVVVVFECRLSAGVDVGTKKFQSKSFSSMRAP